MSSINLQRNIIVTIMSRSLILLLNFVVVVMTTQLWGADGRGSVAIFVADLSLISIFANVFTGSSVSYFFSRLGTSKLSSLAYLWSFLVAAVGAVIVLAQGQTGFAPFIFAASAMMGIIAFHNSLFVGGQKIDYYNLLTVLQPLLLLAFMALCHVLRPQWGYYCYFFGQTFSLLLLIVVCRILRRKMLVRLHWDLDKEAAKSMFSFGWKTEFSSFLQFFNYRLTFYLLDAFVSRGSVGIFSIGVSLAEAIWIVSRSMSMVQFSNVLKQGNTRQSRSETLKIALISLLVSTACVGVALLLPASLFSFVFGPEFGDVKRVILFLAPGILSIAFSNVLGNYFSAIKHLNILIYKSLIGIMVTIGTAFLLIPKWQIDGACFVNSASYVASSIVLLIYFLSKKSVVDIHE